MGIQHTRRFHAGPLDIEILRTAVLLSLHANARHLPAGADPLPVGVPSNIGVANVEGVAELFARQDHVHDHIAGLGVDLHHNEIHGVAEHTDVERDLFVAPHPYTTGTWTITPPGFKMPSLRWADNAEELATFIFKVPSDYVSFVSAVVVINANAAGDLYWTSSSEWAALTEAPNTHNATIALNATAVAQHILTGIDVSALFATAPLLGDIVGVRFSRYADNVLDTINNVCDAIGLIFTYTAAQ